MSTQLTEKTLFTDGVKTKFNQLLGEKAPGFISSVLQVVNSNNLLTKADQGSILNAAATAAALDLPINNNLGFAWIVPFKGKAQFQIGWKGFVQLALRTGQYKAINVLEVYENQFTSFNHLTEEIEADFNKEGSGDVVGYVAYFKLLNGMEKTVFWSTEKVKKHAKKYSQSYSSSFSPWQDKDQFHQMAKKTVLKNTLSKWGIMSIEMQTAQLSDQSTQETENVFDYPDNTIDVAANDIKEEESRVEKFIKATKTLIELDEVKQQLDDDNLLKFTTLLQEQEVFIKSR